MTDNKIQELQSAIIQLQNKCVVDARYVNSEQDIDRQMSEITLSQEDKIISQLVFCITQILKDKLDPSESESDIWTHVNNFLVGRYALEFIKQKCTTIPQDKQKLKLWILLEISQKTLDNVFDHIAATDFLSQYKVESCFRQNFVKLVELSKMLQQQNYKISGRLPQYFEKYVQEQGIKDAKFLPVGNQNQQQAQNQNTQLTPNNTNNHNLNHQNNLLSNYTVVPSIVDITPKHLLSNQETPVNMNNSLRLKENQNSSIKIEINGISQISRVVEESEEDRTGRNNMNIDVKLLLANGRSSTALFNPHGANRATLANSDSMANLYPKLVTPTPDEGKYTKRKLPSEYLFKTRYANITERFSDKFQVQSTISGQDGKCHECQAKISKGLYLIGNNAYFCHYTGFWYCYNCIAVDKKPIPWKALESFDLTSYKVCKKAEKEINNLYAKPIIQFEYSDQVVQSNQILGDFMILKRQIYLLYNFLCHPEYLEKYLENSLNLLIKPNIFSLKNFYDINNGSLPKQVEETYKLFQTHVQECEKCQKKGIECSLCKQPQKIYLFDIKNTSLCEKCDTLYHRTCFQEKNCETCMHEN
ncbi:hypothetical protein TTHERM_00590020 (macronuclear) [Tetrahymena thermophila SB210]|uniref:Rubicon Homology domain-containing protein n=1 Tax=Tetrahymena thermophila (strain SB210) TaxID=312017 RepID=I7MFD5_TETTS|nr:hypothetical protein TTHERM_00590020 [Tetrahymena thermophila SB210]EAR99665.2 hypothetical protein TTHERM_00590020 [Tetrahymena thermophila SB210]|eukprot:XP_001019910.2 hypothetical protein TTHERM_00590020 [Tetrahymena thermophila SB210]